LRRCPKAHLRFSNTAVIYRIAGTNEVGDNDLRGQHAPVCVSLSQPWLEDLWWLRGFGSGQIEKLVEGVAGLREAGFDGLLAWPVEMLGARCMSRDRERRDGGVGLMEDLAVRSRNSCVAFFGIEPAFLCQEVLPLPLHERISISVINHPDRIERVEIPPTRVIEQNESRCLVILKHAITTVPC